ncbi:hypothetical protein CMV_020365 [Castanea mollissima]|uniref:Tyrosine-protein kinase catalytic domain-containing protein n=1 Tax=Castanea mollissima TaxID=60419 RepID=A0A8J4QNA8_9ROSI|nr:hypothetical protein CMV_020365 [Castanea mollissima]
MQKRQSAKLQREKGRARRRRRRIRNVGAISRSEVEASTVADPLCLNNGIYLLVRSYNYINILYSTISLLFSVFLFNRPSLSLFILKGKNYFCIVLAAAMSPWRIMMGMIKEKSIRIEKARHVFEAKEEYFIQNGAMLLEKQITCNQGRDTEPIKIFSAKEIQQATNNYDPNLILGSDIATVYKGMLDEREVAIKVKGPTIYCSTELMVDFFLQQVTIKQLISHKNVVRLYGCCLETKIPMLVLEFIRNGTLSDHLHGQRNKIPCQISWLDRVRIATETSYALCHHPTEMFLRHNNLVDYFVLKMRENCILQIVDDVVLSQGSNEDIQAFAELALRCLNNKGDERPSMREVTIELRRILQLVRSRDSKLSNEIGLALT